MPAVCRQGFRSPIPFSMTKKQLTPFLFLIMTCALQAQDRSFRTLPLVNKPASSRFSSQQASPVSPEEESRIQQIYNRLVQARGDFRYPVPGLVIRPEEQYVAFMNYDKLEISLEVKALEVCRPYGDAGIAFLLGHELTHYYEKHAWRRGFVAENKDLNIGMVLNEVADATAHETEADYLGGFLAYTAGYGLFDEGNEVIGKLYEAYGLPEEINGYPSLSDRKALATRSAERLESLVDLFEMGNLLAAIGQYGEAYTYYREILKSYQSREIYNNLGVTALLDAMDRMKEEEKPFVLPVQLDLYSTASRGSGMAVDPMQLVRQAILHFDAAISLDPGYAPAYLNKACAYTLLKDYPRAEFYAIWEARERARSNGWAKTEQDAEILRAVLLAMQGKKPEARAILVGEEAKGSALAATNRARLDGEVLPLVPVTGGLSATERIDNLTMAKISSDVRVDDKYTRPLDGMNFHKNPGQGPESVLLVNERIASADLLLVHMTRPGYSGATARGLKEGASGQEVVQAYGEPRRTVQTPAGRILVFPQILFIMGNDDRLERWATYKVQVM